ncbi:MraY family glycosyltransferase [Caldalkalibacillus salinus]|uniref:MraY family glycosyltransferase n=1 Tax=Caldalkalibacillus salinus TaxID=2803787 RepID=UPI0019237DB6|nr:MraY family glycosyltransferase [Caldalkalibacillus salinus]
MFRYVLPLVISYLCVYVLIPIVKRWANQYHIVDEPTKRKQHKDTIPLTGGIAIFLGVNFLLFIFLGFHRMTWLFFIGSLLVVGVGVLDDWYKGRQKELSPWPKLLVQFLTATLVYWGGTRIVGVTHWFGSGGEENFWLFPHWLAFLATCLWIVGIMNMFNFIDGMDGLAAGVSIFVTLTLFFISFLKGELTIALCAMILTGGILAFLRHNFHPASIFLGDAGALFLGFSVAFLSVEGAMKGATLITFVVLILAMGVPVFDTLQVILTRLKEGRPIYVADRSHLHHRLLSLGLNQRQVIVILYLIGIGLSITSVLLFFIFG